MKTLTIYQIAEQLQVNPETVRRWCRDGVLQARKLRRRGAPWAVTQEALEAFRREPWEIKKEKEMYIGAWEIYIESLGQILTRAMRDGKVQADDVVWTGPSGDAIVAATAADLDEEYAEYTDSGQVEEYLNE